MNQNAALFAFSVGVVVIMSVLVCFGPEIERWFKKIIKGEDIKKPTK